MNKMKISLAVVVVAFLTVVYVGLSSKPEHRVDSVGTEEPGETRMVDKSSSAPAGESLEAVEPEVRVVKSFNEYPAGIEKAERMLEARQNVFIGKVIGVKGSEPTDRGAVATQYFVEVVSNIKGDLRGEVVVQQSGTGYRDGVLYVKQEDVVSPSKNLKPSDVLLRQEGVYLFMTLVDERKLYTISTPPYDRVLIIDGTGLDDALIAKAVDQNPVVQEYRLKAQRGF